MTDARKEIKKKDGRGTETIDTSNIYLQEENLDQLQNKLCSVCNAVRASIKDGTLTLASLNVADISESQNLTREQ